MLYLLVNPDCLTILQILTTVASGHRGLVEIYTGRVIAGIGIGAISAVAPAYVSECSPKEVRGRITGLFQIMVRPWPYICRSCMVKSMLTEHLACYRPYDFILCQL